MAFGFRVTCKECLNNETFGGRQTVSFILFCFSLNVGNILTVLRFPGGNAKKFWSVYIASIITH